MANRNPFTWVEIYVDNMERAQQFYETVLNVKMEALPAPEGMNDFQMVSFPWVENTVGTSGALVKMPDMKPGAGGTLVYFACEDCTTEIARVEQAGGKVLQPKFPIGDYGFCGICMDTEGNTIGFHSRK